MDYRGDHGGPVAIIGVACRFPGAAEPAEFHDMTVAGRRMFRPLAGAPDRPRMREGEAAGTRTTARSV